MCVAGQHPFAHKSYICTYKHAQAKSHARTRNAHTHAHHIDTHTGRRTQTYKHTHMAHIHTPHRHKHAYKHTHACHTQRPTRTQTPINTLPYRRALNNTVIPVVKGVTRNYRGASTDEVLQTDAHIFLW